MFKQAFANFTDQHLTITGLIIFVTFFLGVLVWVNLKQNILNYEKIQNIPLKDGDDHE